MGAIGGIETNAQSKYEKGEREPRSGYLTALKLLGVDVQYLLTGERVTLCYGALTSAEFVLIAEFRRLRESDQVLLTQLAASLAAER